jgi:cytochrome c2
MFDGKSEAKLCKKMWIIVHKKTGEIVFEYCTYQGNRKKAFFNSLKYAEEALNKYIKNPENYTIYEGGAVR